MDSLVCERIEELFLAIDFNNNGFISADEFAVSYRNIVPNNHGKEFAYLMFRDYMEQEEDPETRKTMFGLRFPSFYHMAMELDYFKPTMQNQYMSLIGLDQRFDAFISFELDSFCQAI